MLGLIGTVGGAVALEIRRIRKKGGPEELKEVKQREKELRELLEATNQELAKAHKQHETAEHKAQQLQQEKASLQQQAAELDKQKEQLQQNNSKLVLTNLMLYSKAKHLEDSSRELVAKQEDLQHQLEQLQRERQVQIEASEATLALLKDQVTAVLNRYLSKDIDLQVALQEMQALGIELVPLDTTEARPDNVVEFEPKFVLESPHRMQHLMNAAVGRLLPGARQQDVPTLAFPMAIKDPTTGMSRVALGWRQEPQGAAGSIMGLNDADQQVLDQQQGSDAGTTLGQLDTASARADEALSRSAPKLSASSDGKQALTFTAASKKQQPSNTGFSLGFGSLGRLSKANAASSKVAVVPSSMLKAGAADDDDMSTFSSTALATR